MATENEKKEQLIDFLEKKAFEPVLKAPESKFKTVKEKEKLQDVQKSTQSEQQRFRRYKTAKQVKENYLKDLNSSTAKKINKELNELHLPKLPDFKNDFLKLCEKLEV